MSNVIIVSRCRNCDLSIAAGSAFCDGQCRADYDLIQSSGSAEVCSNSSCRRPFRTISRLRFCGQCEPMKSRAVRNLQLHECAGSDCSEMVSYGVDFHSHRCYRASHGIEYFRGELLGAGV